MQQQTYTSTYKCYIQFIYNYIQNNHRQLYTSAHYPKVNQVQTIMRRDQVRWLMGFI